MYLIINFVIQIFAKLKCGGKYKIPIHIIIEKPALIAITRIGQKREGDAFSAEKYISDITNEVNDKIKDIGVIVEPYFYDINETLKDKWTYECREPSPIITRTMIAARHFHEKRDILNVIYVFFCPDMYLGDFQTIAYSRMGNCGSFVGILHSAVDKVFKKRVSEAVIAVLLQGLYHTNGLNVDMERIICSYSRTCFQKNNDQ
ncbi:hypothetical protein DMUE_2124 [Dictyocoela muelleri]|nr:hypothetical protein DMUE_2124 [Dictyocoela muelleri]